jgi:NAD(P)-dependent dehydrogenase (short-subunit alcohol dehydrogenase family)
MVDTTVAELGRLDVLVNNAAVTFIGDIDIPQHRHDLVMAIDLDAPIVACRHAIEHLRAAGEGRIVNVSSLAALQPFPAVMSYGIAKIGLERFSVDLARQLAKDGIAVNVFRIDVPVASEGFVANTPHADHSDWEPSSVAAEGILWMVGQPVTYTGRRESMHHLAAREGIMPSIVARPGPLPPTELYNGLYEGGDDFFEEPHQEVTT